MSTPINNLVEPHFEPSESKPGVSGESINAPYGPKAAYECGIMGGKEEGERFEKNHKANSFAVGKTSGPKGGF